MEVDAVERPAQQHDGDGGDDQLPGGEAERRHAPDGALQQDDAETPAQRGGDHEGDADGLGAHAAEIAPQQRADPGHAQRQRRQDAAGQPLAEDQGAEQRGPDRHGVGDQDGAAGGQVGQPEGAEHLPAADVDQRDGDQGRPFALRHRHVLPRQPGDDEQHQGAGRDGGGTERPGGHFVEHDFHGGPGHTPGQGDHDQ